eukprot:PhF_6_TR33638/c2_g1_i5/m.49166
MISLLSQIVTTASADGFCYSFLPRDCVNYIMQFTDTTTTSSMFLVCRCWYQSMDRFLLLADTFYYLPERYREEINESRKKASPCLSSSLPTLMVDARWDHVDAMVFNVPENMLDTDSFPPSLTSLDLRDSRPIFDTCVARLSTLTSLTTLDLDGYTTDVGASHLPSLISLKSAEFLWM